MAGELYAADIHRQLNDLDRRDPARSVFGAALHQYLLRPPLSSRELESWEERHGVTLPAQYRLFITAVGDGGAGPHYGLFPFGYQDDLRGLCSWEAGGIAGDPAAAFPHRGAWNLPEEFWHQAYEPVPGLSAAEDERRWDEWQRTLERHYWDPALLNGAIPICHLGCAKRHWLVVSGGERGSVWADDRVENGGLYPLGSWTGAAARGEERLSFTEWYCGWLAAIRDELARDDGV